MKIGFPRALFYYDYFPFWAGFFHQLGIEIVTSPATTRQTMEQGLKKASDETCLPLKLLAGHIQALKEVDAIFLPRMVSVDAQTYNCPKFLGIPESLLPAVPQGIPVLTVTINWQRGQRAVLKALIAFGVQLGKSKGEVKKAFNIGNKWQIRYQASRGSGWDFEESMHEFEREVGELTEAQPADELSWGAWKGRMMAKLHVRALPRARSVIPAIALGSERLRIALVGHSYLTYEPYANLNLLERLRKQAEVELIQHVKQEEIDTHLLGLRKKIFWSHARQIYGAGKKFALDPQINGIIYLSCFGCGTDSIVQGLLARFAREQHKPYMMITLDEHSGEAGLVTRLEAFLDMVERRKAHEGYLSTHGERLDRNSNTF